MEWVMSKKQVSDWEDRIPDKEERESKSTPRPVSYPGELFSFWCGFPARQILPFPISK